MKSNGKPFISNEIQNHEKQTSAELALIQIAENYARNLFMLKSSNQIFYFQVAAVEVNKINDVKRILIACNDSMSGELYGYNVKNLSLYVKLLTLNGSDTRDKGELNLRCIATKH